MATDSEARATGNSAMTIALVALVLVAIGAFAFFTMGNRTTETAGTNTTVITPSAAPDVEVNVPPVVVNGGGSSGGATGGTTGGTTGGASGGGDTTGGAGGGSSAP